MYKNEWKEHKFGRQKNLKNDIYKIKKKQRLMVLMLIKYQFLKKNHIVQEIHLNILLDTVIMMLLDHYVSDFHK